MFGRKPTRRRPRIERLWLKQLSWYQVPLWAALVPASLAYGAAVRLRNAFWRTVRQRADARIVSVGNLTVGGNGKTPFTLFLASRLQAYGFSVAIVSRGFARRASRRTCAKTVSEGGELKLSPDEAGDEPAMMAKTFSGPLVVARRRIDGVNLLRQTTNPDFVILDDAFQHVRLARDVDLVLVSRERGLGNGWTLPAGPMREQLGAVKRAQAVILVSWDGAEQPGALGAREMAALARRPVLQAVLRPRSLVTVEHGRWFEVPLELAGRRVLAVSGLADPRGFYAMLRGADADLMGVLEYPDHFRYALADWQEIVDASRNADMVVTTEKDLVKLEQFPFARNSLYALRLEVAMSAQDARALDELVIGEALKRRAVTQG
jgi:tetraacyldisaccharide 4'-kinase